ncbi:ABC transporter permease [Tessaracoccus sp. ZS01]|uniref:ABC transporter permease n=1 Tax=Tessaracoccus sp. ZS01 TaxID=1906324 RepID=UPI00096D4CA9|nr:ABC transporter permease [Tessaracoccus sp. ZS01]MCG6568204.1 ABC transporter permease [Tessaracoccus sp. ZS01]OMG53447.1 ABC transporter permease [Tessaracoccus sp. ZS01]
MKRLLRNKRVVVGLAVLAFFILVAILGPWFVEYVLRINPRAVDYQAIAAPPGAEHWLGTNNTGQDVLAQLVIGARGSVVVGALSGTIATVMAVLVGTASGYIGGNTDRTINAIINVLMTLPGFALLFIIAGYVQNAGYLLIALVIGLLGWPGGARSIRAQTLSLRSRDFTSALRTSGESTWRIIVVEVIPHLGGIISSMFLGALVGGIFAESSLAFLGLGDTSGITWGTMIAQAQGSGAILRGQWWYFLPPGLCIALIGFATAMINFGLDEVTNPKLNATLAARTRRFNSRVHARRTSEVTA